MFLSIIRSYINSTSDTPSSKDAESIEDRVEGWMGTSSDVASGKGSFLCHWAKAAESSPGSVQMSRKENVLAFGENPIKSKS
jgi:hypothetical protein